MKLKREQTLRRLAAHLLLTLVLICGISVAGSFAADDVARETPKVIFVLEDNAANNQSILKGFREFLRKQAGQLVRIDLLINNAQTQLQLSKELNRGYDLIIPVGDRSLKAVLATETTTPVFAVQASQTELRAIYRQALKQSRPVSGIYQDQPFERYAALIQNLLPQYQRVGILLSQKTKFLKPLFDEVMTKYQFQPVANILLNNDLPQRILERLAVKCDLVIAINDEKVYNPNNIKAHLLTAFRHKIPMIGTSANFAKVGAIVSIYSNGFKLGQQIAQQILPVVTQGDKLPPPMYPDAFELAINYNVLKSFDAEGVDVEQLHTSLKKVPVMSR